MKPTGGAHPGASSSNRGQRITAEAGLTAARRAARGRTLGTHELPGLEGHPPTVHGHAVEALADKRWSVVRELWTPPLKPGEVEVAGARVRLCVRQTHLKNGLVVRALAEGAVHMLHP